ncbi:hypothetical protein Cgig2_028627 [Carnegiea gigantea]|uniref:Post-SET domain-containing protein n=1 Tax=Carnegiea gigantea TaxID=171969 RepID=A0A9Q1JUQ7_9CARY|nr:hypothetical protein Cgig2_028627 [Carnegiea gigantea]
MGILSLLSFVAVGYIRVSCRCSDANLIEVPVEVETPKHYYYHIALFTTRKVDAFEELTWGLLLLFEFLVSLNSSRSSPASRPLKIAAEHLYLKLCQELVIPSDYGIDFDDNEQHIKAFRCLCGSKFCRNMKRSSSKTTLNPAFMAISDNTRSSESRRMEELYNQMQRSLEEFKEQQERVNVSVETIMTHSKLRQEMHTEY